MSNEPSKRGKTDLAVLEQIDKQLAAEAKSIKEQVSAGGGGPRLTINANGNWQTPDGAELGPSIRVIVLDFLTRHTWYPHPYQKGNPLPPGCFAVGKVLSQMAPDESAPEKQHDTCSGCPMNEWGSAATGNGKACTQRRELAVILEEQAEDLENAEIFVISLSPTQIKVFDGFARQCERILNGPPIKAVVSIEAVPVPGARYFGVSFVEIAKNENVADHFQLREEALALLDVLPDTTGYIPSSQKPGKAPAARR